MVSNPRRVAIPVLVLVVVFCLAPPSNADPLEEAATRAGEDPAGLLELAQLYIESRRLEDAETALRRALRDPSVKSKALLGLARVEIAAGELQRAKRSCRALKRKDKKGLGEICEGELWLSADRTSRAVGEFRTAIKKGAHALGTLGLAKVLHKQGDYTAALAAYDEAASAGAGYRALLGKGLALEAQKKNEAALAAFQRALTAQPASSAAHYHAGRLSKPGPKAVALLRTATSLRPDWPQGLHALGGALLATGDNAGALEAFKKAENAGGSMGAACFGQAQALDGLGRSDEARTALEKTIEAVPTHGEALLLLSRLCAQSGDSASALKTLEKARSALPEEASVYVATGEIYHRIGRDTAARSFLKHALTLEPQNTRALVLLGDIDCARRLYAQGKSSYRAALAGNLGELTVSQIERKIAACKRKEEK